MSNEYKDWESDTIAEQKEVVDLYPFLAERDVEGNVALDSHFPMMCLEIPDGWYELFFQMCEEIKDALKAKSLLNEFYFIQIKEKYGELVCYANRHVDEVEDIIAKYSEMSRYICMACGRIARYTTKGHIVPMCDGCLQEKGATGSHPAYSEITSDSIAQVFAKYEDTWKRYLKVIQLD